MASPSTAVIDGHALVVGVSRYAELEPLPHVTDAEDVAQVLTDPTLCAYPPASVELLVDAAATREAIVLELERLAREVPPSASVLFYFSGHGGRHATGAHTDCYLMPVESSWATPEALTGTAIAGRELAQLIRSIPAQRVTIVLDCCQAAGLAEPKAAQPPAAIEPFSPESLALLSQGRGRAVLAASKIDGNAYALQGRRNGIFTTHLLAGLRGGASSVGGVIRVCDLFHYVQQRVVAELPAQRPVFKAELEENYALALFRGGQTQGLTLPAASDSYAYDAFVSHSKHPAERAWVDRVLTPRLERLGLKLCLAHRDFRLGAPRIRELERAVERSRYTLTLLSPSYLAGSFEEFQTLLAQHHGLETRAARVIPMLFEKCEPRLSIRTAEWLDVSDPSLQEATLSRLAQRLREQPELE